MARHFIVKTPVEPGSLIEAAGAPVVARYEAVMQSLSGVAAPESRSVLAEPVLSYGNDAAPATVAWYTGHDGQAQPLSDLDPEAAEAARGLLGQRLMDIAEGLRDPSFGPLVGAALNIRDPEDIWVVGDQPVLVRWGMAPPAAVASSAERNRHFMATLAPFLPLSEAPPISSDAWRERNGGGGRGAAAAAGVGAAGLATGDPAAASAARDGEARPLEGGGGGGDAHGGGALPPQGPGGEGVEESDPGGRWRWAPLLVLLMLAAGALVWLLWPGTRIMPPAPQAALVEDEQALEIAREVNASLEERARRLEAAIEGAVCSPEGDLLLPDGRTPEGLLPPSPAAGGAEAAEGGAAGPADPAEGAADALVPPSPDRVEAPEASRAGESGEAARGPASLLQLIESRTALVLAQGPEGLSTGSGFFVGPDLMVTNHHVVTQAGPGGVFVVNKRLGGVHEAEVLETLGPLQEAGGDFALLRVEGVSGPFFSLRDSTETMRLQNVVAAGYPGVVLETDAAFDRLQHGDANAIPEMAVTDGIVNVEQELSPVTRAIIHTARISPGNSGGPLVDNCGRVVGVNTFGRSESRTNRHLNFSLASTDLLRFLDEAGADPRRASGPCRPQLRRAEAPPRAEATEPAEADPAEAEQ
jgi:S1-C subfamily serine protease